MLAAIARERPCTVWKIYTKYIRNIYEKKESKKYNMTIRFTYIHTHIFHELTNWAAVILVVLKSLSSSVASPFQIFIFATNTPIETLMQKGTISDSNNSVAAREAGSLEMGAENDEHGRPATAGRRGGRGNQFALSRLCRNTMRVA
jgi:hypothetical protein